MKLHKLLYLTLGITVLAITNVSAATLPAFNVNNQINTKDWYESNGWTNGNIQSCVFLKDNMSLDGNNLKITLNNQGNNVAPYACGELQSMLKYGYGSYEASIKTANGSGLNTAFFTYVSNPHDEIDFEFLGKNPKTVQVNYFAQGHNYGGVSIPLAFDASQTFHNYKFVWLPTGITWYIDNVQVFHTKVGAIMLPTTPSRIYLSLWSGSKLVNGWLGAFTYTKPVDAEFAWIKFTPYNTTNPSLPPY